MHRAGFGFLLVFIASQSSLAQGNKGNQSLAGTWTGRVQFVLPKANQYVPPEQRQSIADMNQWVLAGSVVLKLKPAGRFSCELKNLPEADRYSGVWSLKGDLLRLKAAKTTLNHGQVAWMELPIQVVHGGKTLRLPYSKNRGSILFSR